ncbi:MAG: N-acetylmuramoyl-L-alanine amidase [Oscillospiraceae bacterium]|nr:N-acetylmuramoyl-L-alanine amidase [Oscillospiraceae bacterium]
MSKTITEGYPITSFNGIAVDTSLPCKSSNYTASASRAVSYIVVHYTGNSKDTAKANANYFNSTSVEASAHYFVDDSSCYQSVALNNRAWHCGGTTVYKHATCRNANSIGIEMACTAGNYTVSDTTIANAAYLCAALCAYIGISADEVDTYVLRYYDVWGKSCPAQWVSGTGFEEFKAKVKTILNGGAVESEDLTMTQYEELNERVSALEGKMIYNYVDANMPDWAVPTVQKLMDKGILQGNENGELGLTDELLRVLVINDRAGLYD